MDKTIQTRFTLRNKFLFAMLFFALIPLLVVSVISYTIAKNMVFDLTISNLEVINSTQSEKLDTLFNSVVKRIRVLQTSQTIFFNLMRLHSVSKDRSSKEYQDAKKSLNQTLQVLQRSSQFDDIYLLDNNGIVLYASDEGRAWKYLGKPLPQSLEWTKSKTQYGVSYTALFLNTSKGGDYDFIVEAPIYDENGQIHGKVAFEVPMLPFFAVTESRVGLGETGESFLAQKKDIPNEFIIVSPLRDDKNAILRLTSNVKIDKSKRYQDFVNYRKKEVLSVTTPLTMNDLFLFTMMNKSEIYRNIENLRYISYLIALLTSLLIIVTAPIFAFTISKPLQTLMAATKGLSSRKFDVEIDEKLKNKQDEVGNLANAFSIMIVALKEYYQSLVESRNVAENAKNEAIQALQKLKMTQSKLVQAEKMSSLGVLTAGIAHEINNPINFVLSNAKPLKADIADLFLLLESYDKLISTKDPSAQLSEIEKIKKDVDIEYLGEEIKQLLEGISEGANRTAAIVKSLRTFSRFDESAIKKTDIHDGLEATIMMLKSQRQEKVQIKKEYGEDIPEIDCYPGDINQVFMNILQNAFQAIQPNGIVTIKTSKENGFIQVSIKDDGVGMNEETKKHIFEPFFTTREVGKGTGLGLSVSLGIINSHHGKIEVKSELGKGSEFIVTLPVTQP